MCLFLFLQESLLADSDIFSFAVSSERSPEETAKEKISLLADSDIFSFAVSSGERSVLVEDSFTQSAATIFSGKVYWVDSQSGSTDIYTLDMGGSCSIDLGDCADDDADISPVAEEVCDDEI